MESKYPLLNATERELSDYSELDNRERDIELRQPRSVAKDTFTRRTLAAFLTISLAANAILGFLLLNGRQCDASQIPSKFAGLLRNVPKPWDPYSPYGLGNKNETDRALLWEQLDASPGQVSLDIQWAKEHDLPEAQYFPWDHDRQMYLLNGHHSLHCLRKIHRWVTISHHNGTQLDGYVHVVHCMDHLLNNIICEADDTPMYETPTKKKDAGNEQTRMCRSWDKLNEWAAEQTACYVFVNETQGVDTTFARYKFCPEGSPYTKAQNEHYGRPEGFWKERPQEIESMPPYWEDFKEKTLVFHEETEV